MLTTKTKIFVPGGYEKITEGSTTKEFYYISTPAGITSVYEKVNGSGAMYYIHPDHLGSVNYITNSSGSVVQELGFDSWGRQRNAANWTYTSLPAPKFDRGYTFHEHLDAFELINMNGRMYDSRIGRFLSPDPVLQSPGNLQNYNRYSYVLNNPLKYTDPSGYLTEPKSLREFLQEAWKTEYGGSWSSGGGGSATFFTSHDEAVYGGQMAMQGLAYGEEHHRLFSSAINHAEALLRTGNSGTSISVLPCPCWGIKVRTIEQNVLPVSTAITSLMQRRNHS